MVAAVLGRSSSYFNAYMYIVTAALYVKEIGKCCLYKRSVDVVLHTNPDNRKDDRLLWYINSAYGCSQPRPRYVQGFTSEIIYFFEKETFTRLYYFSIIIYTEANSHHNTLNNVLYVICFSTNSYQTRHL